MQLGSAKLRQFYTDGYIVLPGLIPLAMIHAARKAINAHFGQHGIPPEELTKYKAQSWCTDLKEEPVITDLFNRTPMTAAMGELLGDGSPLPATMGQIALRFPDSHSDQSNPRGHLDGVGTGSNGIPVGEFKRSFSALAVVLLSDLPEPYCGNFTVWPGSHHVVERYFQQATPEVLRKGTPKFVMPRGHVQITGKAGDVVISHHQMIHCPAPNTSPNVRYAAIFRPKHKDTAELGTKAMTDIWREWEPVRRAVGID